MISQQNIQHSYKKDKYVNARGGNSHFLDIYCSRCGQHLALYQKDGHGSLLRMYLDRIFEPPELSALQFNNNDKKEIPNFQCSKCGSLIGTPMAYEKENRLAFRLLHGSFIKKTSDGVSPSFQQSRRPPQLKRENGQCLYYNA